MSECLTQLQANHKNISETDGDAFAVQFYDENRFSEEERFLILKIISLAKLLFVSHCEHEQGAVIRIISARKATKRESAFYRGD